MTPADRQLMTQMLRQNEQPVWHASPEVRRCFRQLGEIVDAEGATERLSLLAVHLNELFVLLFRMFRQGDVPLDESLTSPLRTVEMFWRELESQPALLVREWTLPQMARSCRLGLTRFVEYSRQINNASPMHHLSRLRIELACRVLVERPERSITEVALDCGFASSQYFSKVFRQQKKCTPGVFRSVSAPSH
jgi:AraC family L-rhamnose operon regulatory protein RhaS